MPPLPPPPPRRFYNERQLVTLDETSKDLAVLKRAFGYSLRGQPVMTHDGVTSRSALGGRVSALTLLTAMGGFIEWAFTSGTFKAENFLEVTTQAHTDWRGERRRPLLIDQLGPYAMGGSSLCAVLMDGATIHGAAQRRGLNGAVAAMGARIHVIPPYCWFLSALDNGAYGRLVQWLQEHDAHVKEVGIRQALDDGMRQLRGPEFGHYCFGRAGYLGAPASRWGSA